MPSTPESLQKFVRYCQQHLKGDEKGESQNFLDRFFQAFGHEGVKEAGATLEERVKKGSKKGNTGFADLAWKPHLLIEMKKRGEDLNKHYAQAVTYWMQLQCPSYVMLCNFDEFWIYDFRKQSEEPIEKIALERLPERAGAFAFMNPEVDRAPVFNNNLVSVTEKAARRMGELLTMLIERKQDAIDPKTAQRFVLQCVLAMFAEDRNLLPDDLFISVVRECLERSRQGKPSNTYDILGNLFQEMNRPGTATAGRYQGVEYFNGGLFREVHPLELTEKELELLELAASQDWKAVRPSIFGNIFESAIGKSNSTERHAHGIHFTSEEDILKIVRPTITRYWEEKIKQATTLAELSTLQTELRDYKVLDPACGSGNFLYMAYLELKRLERVLQDKIDARRRSESGQGQMSIGFVTPQQFYGMDTNEFAVELARVTLMIARKVAIDLCDIHDQPALPLDTLDENIVCQDALFTEWVKADAIIGNPPFLGGYRLRQELGDEQVNRVFERFPGVVDQVDISSYWFRLSHENLSGKGRAGLVATNTISQGKTRKAGLDYVTHSGGIIHDAVSTQPWSGEAKVHVSIVNWCYEKTQERYLDGQIVASISSSLKSTTDVSTASRLTANLSYCLQGVMPGGKGFLITEQEAQFWIQNDRSNKRVLKLFLDGSNLAKVPDGKPDRWIIDFDDMTVEDASDYQLPFNHIKTTVKPERDQNRRDTRRLNWWKLGENAPKMRRAIAPLKHYFAVPETSKWFIFLLCPANALPGKATKPVASEDFYILGILTSNVHRTWVKAQSSTLEDRTRYTHNTCFETFPFPQTSTPNLITAIRSTAQDLHDYRSTQMEKKQWGITKLYNEYFHEPTSQLFKLHAKLDQLVMQAYGFNPDDDLLEKLLTLNLELAEKEKRGVAIVGAWAP
ncbi:class I SAM-dependent DNA methyltransferase [Myxacorys almedinensis]|uniref:site-specific DNA-methyltransferase (adenine-specific) n=1 Tax=Myxacorys almedinensis A TaxID=2690445 RepID=A0A8J7Z103_9CYAN|nr:DNA methyltransferase [Myxacorys almedinensis]NDJ16186.1 N-6 DNA methylase [Myxacorys almedinensis A]